MYCVDICNGNNSIVCLVWLDLDTYCVRYTKRYCKFFNGIFLLQSQSLWSIMRQLRIYDSRYRVDDQSEQSARE